MLLEIIFKGVFSVLNLSFLSQFIINGKDLRFNYPENYHSKNFEEIVKKIEDNEYVDFVITTDEFYIDERIIPKVFINITKDKDNVEILLYFDLQDFNKKDTKKGIDELINWTNSFKINYNFNYYVCQIDNADEMEYYFDSNGIGPLYDSISRC